MKISEEEQTLLEAMLKKIVANEPELAVHMMLEANGMIDLEKKCPQCGCEF